jgi:glycosyltransferase involved in cell wall biosynthesis
MNTAHPSEARGCAIVPAYLEEGRIGKVVRRILEVVRPVIVIDDGSPDRTAEEAAAAGAIVLRHDHNRGKGAALHTGFAYAKAHAFEYLITLDADGQHAPGDIPRFLEAYARTGLPVLVGNRMDDPRTMPLARRLTNRFMSGYLSREMKQFVPDTQCGFRLYRCDILPAAAPDSAGYAAESEILLHLAAAGVKMGSVPITVIYQDEVSKIRPVRDTIRFFKMVRRFRRQQATNN